MRSIILASMLLMPVFSFGVELHLVDGRKLSGPSFKELDAFNPPTIVDGKVRRLGAIGCEISAHIFFKRRHDLILCAFLGNLLYDQLLIDADGLTEPDALRKLVHKLNPVKYIKGKQMEQSAQQRLLLEEYSDIEVSIQEAQFDNVLRAMDLIAVMHHHDYINTMNDLLHVLTRSKFISEVQGLQAHEHSPEFLAIIFKNGTERA